MSMTLQNILVFGGSFMDAREETRPLPVQQLDDDALVAAAKAGRDDAFEELVRRYRNEVFAFSHYFVRDREEAWDLSQEVFVKAYKSLRRFRGDAAFKTWLMRITANRCKDHLKKRRLETIPLDEAIHTGHPSEGDDPASGAQAAELGKAIDAAVAGLPPKHQLAFVLREYQGLSYQEMAEVMDCNVGTVMSRLHHARKKLQDKLIAMGVREA